MSLLAELDRLPIFLLESGSNYDDFFSVRPSLAVKHVLPITGHAHSRSYRNHNCFAMHILLIFSNILGFTMVCSSISLPASLLPNWTRKLGKMSGFFHQPTWQP